MPPTAQLPTTQLTALRQRIRQLEQHVCHGVLPFGAEAIDRVLPEGGLALGAVHEVLGAGGDEEDGAAAAGFIAGILTRISPSRMTLWCLKQPDLYAPGLRQHGLDPARLVLVTARRDADLLWAIEEALQPGSGVCVVVGEVGRLPMVASRRLQLAAERSGITAFLLRRWRNAAEAIGERERPSAALTRWRVTSVPSQDGNAAMVAGMKKGVGRARWRIELLRCRAGLPGSWEVEATDATGLVSVSARLADRPVAPSRLEFPEIVPLRRAG